MKLVFASQNFYFLSVLLCFSMAKTVKVDWMLRLALLCVLCALSCSPLWAQEGRSPLVPMLKLDMLEDRFAVGARAGDAAHEARFRVTATTGGMRAGDGTWGEKMVGFRVPVPQIVKGGAGLFGIVGDKAEGAPRVIMTQPLTDENGVARGKVVSGMRLVNVQLGYPNAGAIEIDSAWNELDESWTQPRVLALDEAHDISYRMSFERNESWLPIRGHQLEFVTLGLAGQLWRRDYGPDLDGDGRPDGDYIVANFAVPRSDAGVLAGTLEPATFDRLTQWQPRVTRGAAGVYTARVTARYDPRFVVDSLRVHLWDNSAYEAAGNLQVSNDPRALQPRLQQLDAKAPLAPAVWDRATVTRLLRDIEKPRNAALLRGLYFGAHRAHALPVEAGRALLASAATQAKSASRRWFLLMSLRGFAELRAGEADSAAAGFAAYRALFDNAARAPAVGAQTIVRAAVADFVNTAPLGYDQYELNDAKGDNAATVAAWKAYSQSQSWPRNAAERASEPLWNLKWEDGVPSDLVLYIARQSQSWKEAPLPWRFAAAGALSAGNQQQAAFALWSRLKNELGKDDLDRLNIVYERLDNYVTWLGSMRANPSGGKALPASITWKQAAMRRQNLAQERTQRWDFGWAQRLDAAPDAARMRIARQLLARPNTAHSRDEIARAVREMFRRAFDLPSDISFNKSAVNATGVLARSLLARPGLTREQQWETRLLLATLLERLGRKPEAVEVLAVPFGAPPTKKEDDLLERVQMARRAIGS